MHDRIRQSWAGELGSGGNRIRALGVHICPQRCRYCSKQVLLSLPLSLSTDLRVRTQGLCSGSTDALLPAVTLALAFLASLLQAVQSIGNLGQQLGQGKELWMAPLHPFLLQSISRVRHFLDQLVDVNGEEGESLCSCHIRLVTLWTLGTCPSPHPPPVLRPWTCGSASRSANISWPPCARSQR